MVPAAPKFARAVGRVLFCGLSRTRERQRLSTALHEVDEQPFTFRMTRLPPTAFLVRPFRERLVVLRWIPEYPVTGTAPGGVLVDEGDSLGVTAGDGRDVLDWVVDRRRTADVRRIRVEPLTGSGESPEGHRHLRAEHATVAVDLVDDDVLQRGKEPLPEPSSVRQQRVMEHVGVREQDGGAGVPNVPLFGPREPARVRFDGHAAAEA